MTTSEARIRCFCENSENAEISVLLCIQVVLGLQPLAFVVTLPSLMIFFDLLRSFKRMLLKLISDGM